MADAKFFSKGKASEIEEELKALDRAGKPYKKKDILKRIVANMTMGNDMSSLFNHVIQCAAIQDPEVKKLIYLYLINYAKSLPDLATLAVNLLVKDSADPNPLVRAQAIRTMGYLPTLDITQCLCEVLRRGLKDADAFVRKTSVVGVSKLFFHNSSLCIEEGFLSLLQDMLHTDKNNLVIACILATLREIGDFFPELKLSISFEEANLWLSSLDKCSEWYQVYVIDSLISFVPNRYEEVETLALKLFPRLQHINAAVCMSCIKVLLYLLPFVSKPEFHKVISQKISTALVTMMQKDPEIQFMTLQNIILIIAAYPSISLNEVSVFFCLYNDPIYVKLAKLEVMVALANESNAPQILSELKEYALEIDVDFVKRAVKHIGRCAIQIPSMAHACVEVLNELIETHVGYVLEEVIVVLRDIFRKYPNQYEYLIERISEYLDEIQDSEAKAAFIWILGQYCDRIPQAGELLLDFSNDFALEPSNVQHALLTATVRLYLRQLPHCDKLYKTVMEISMQAIENPDLRDRAFIYHRLIQHDADLAQKAHLQMLPIISFETKQKLSKPLMKELSTCLGSLASVLHKSPETLTAQKPIQNLDALQTSMDMLQNLTSNDIPPTIKAQSGKQLPATPRPTSQPPSSLIDFDMATPTAAPSTLTPHDSNAVLEKTKVSANAISFSSSQSKTNENPNSIFNELSTIVSTNMTQEFMHPDKVTASKSFDSAAVSSTVPNLPLSSLFTSPSSSTSTSTASSAVMPSPFSTPTNNSLPPPATPPRQASLFPAAPLFNIPASAVAFPPPAATTTTTSSSSSNAFSFTAPPMFSIPNNTNTPAGGFSTSFPPSNFNGVFTTKPPAVASQPSSQPPSFLSAPTSGGAIPFNPPMQSIPSSNQVPPVAPSSFPPLPSYPISMSFAAAPMTHPTPTPGSSTSVLLPTLTSSVTPLSSSTAPFVTNNANTTQPIPILPMSTTGPTLAQGHGNTMTTLPEKPDPPRPFPTLLKRQEGGGLEIKGVFQSTSFGTLSLELQLTNTTMGVLTNLALKLKDNHVGLQVPATFPCAMLSPNVATPVTLSLTHGHRNVEQRVTDIEAAIRTSQGIFFFKIPLPFVLHFTKQAPPFSVDTFFAQFQSTSHFEKKKQLLNTLDAVKRKLVECHFQMVASNQETGETTFLNSYFGAYLITQAPVCIHVKSNASAPLSAFDKLMIHVVSPAKFMIEDTLNYLEGP